MQSKLYQNGLYMRAPPVPGAKEALQKLKDMGYWYVEHGKVTITGTILTFVLVLLSSQLDPRVREKGLKNGSWSISLIVSIYSSVNSKLC